MFSPLNKSLELVSYRSRPVERAFTFQNEVLPIRSPAKGNTSYRFVYLCILINYTLFIEYSMKIWRDKIISRNIFLWFNRKYPGCTTLQLRVNLKRLKSIVTTFFIVLQCRQNTLQGKQSNMHLVNSSHKCMTTIDNDYNWIFLNKSINRHRIIPHIAA